MKIFLAKYEHKHGTDERAFKTRKGAEWQLAQWAEEYKSDWEPFWGDSKDAKSWTTDELVDKWTDITGGNEFLYIEELPLLDLKSLDDDNHVKEK